MSVMAETSQLVGDGAVRRRSVSRVYSVERLDGPPQGTLAREDPPRQATAAGGWVGAGQDHWQPLKRARNAVYKVGWVPLRRGLPRDEFRVQTRQRSAEHAHRPHEMPQRTVRRESSASCRVQLQAGAECKLVHHVATLLQ